MEQDNQPQGQAVTSGVTIQTLTLPDGSKRDVFSRPVGDPQATLDWLQRRFDEKPRKWHDLRDYYKAIFGGEPPAINSSIRKRLRGYIKRACAYAGTQQKHIERKTDGAGGITHIRLLDRSDPGRTFAAIKNGVIPTRRLERGVARRVATDCAVLGVDADQLDEIITIENRAKATEAAQ